MFDPTLEESHNEDALNDKLIPVFNQPKIQVAVLPGRPIMTCQGIHIFLFGISINYFVLKKTSRVITLPFHFTFVFFIVLLLHFASSFAVN